MRHIVYKQSDRYPVAIIINTTAFNETNIKSYYVDPLEKLGLHSDEICVFDLKYDQPKKVSVKTINAYLEELLPVLDELDTKTIYVADANYFKKLSGERKADPHLGYVLPCVIAGFEHMNIIYGINYAAIMFNPAAKPKLEMSLETLTNHWKGKANGFSGSIIKKASYPSTADQITACLKPMLNCPALACDIETFGLNHYECGIGSISFSANETSGVAFLVDYVPLAEPMEINGKTHYGMQRENNEIRYILLTFLIEYVNRGGTLIFHNAPFDAKVLIYNLWMQRPSDLEGLLVGHELLTRNMHDTMAISYLALNSTSKTSLSLKDLSHEYTGNYAEDVTDIRLIKPDALLKYNIYDTCATFYIYNKYWPRMIADDQLYTYETITLPTQKTLIEIELTGIQIDPNQVQIAKKELVDILDAHYKLLAESEDIAKARVIIAKRAYDKDYEARVGKAKNPDKIMVRDWDEYLETYEDFNPGSPLQMRVLLYEVLNLPVLGLTKTKQPGTDGKIMDKLKKIVHDDTHIELLNSLVDISKASKVLSTFIPIFENAVELDGTFFIFGSLYPGPVSGRLASARPNLMNIPAGSDYGKAIKRCIISSDDWILCGADFNSLEDMANALLTNDPNKLKVYTDGYDSHSMRSYAYFKDEMPDIVDTVESINTISDKYPKLRQKSKGATFALTFAGTWSTLVKNLGFTKKEAVAIEANYHRLYKVSTEWVADKIKQAHVDGYVTGAFGLRIRTPLLEKTVHNSKATPSEAKAEGRTAGNAISGQSYNMLTMRALNEFLARVKAHPEMRLKVKPSIVIHDAIYPLVRNQLHVLKWVNDNLIECMKWQELPEIKHDQVKLGAELDVFYRNWACPITLPNNVTELEIVDTCQKQMVAYD